MLFQPAAGRSLLQAEAVGSIGLRSAQVPERFDGKWCVPLRVCPRPSSDHRSRSTRALVMLRPAGVYSYTLASEWNIAGFASFSRSEVSLQLGCSILSSIDPSVRASSADRGS